MKTIEFEHIQKWTNPANYAGEQYPEYYIAYSQHRDSDLLTQSNWDYILNAVGGESNTVIVARSSHWAVGWLDVLLIHESDIKNLEIADNLIYNIKEEYPILDENDFYQRENDYKNEVWSCMSLKERIDFCKCHGVTIFASRHDYLSHDLDMYIETN